MTTRTDAPDELGRIDGEAMSETDEARLEHIEHVNQIKGGDFNFIIGLAREALASRARIAELNAERVRLWNELRDERGKHDVTRAALTTLRAQVETLRSALEPFSYLVDTLKCSRDENSWVMKVEGREPITVADLRRARAALQSLSATEPSR